MCYQHQWMADGMKLRNIELTFLCVGGEEVEANRSSYVQNMNPI